MLFLHHYPMPTYIGISHAISSPLSYANLSWHLLCYFFTIILIFASLMLFLYHYPMQTYIGISYAISSLSLMFFFTIILCQLILVSILLFLHHYPNIGISYVIFSTLSYANLYWHLLCYFFTIILCQLKLASFMLFLHYYPPMFYDS